MGKMEEKWNEKEDVWRKALSFFFQTTKQTGSEQKKQSQKRYMVSDSLFLTSFISVEFKVSLVVSGQCSFP